MKTMRLLSLLLAGFLAACGAEESAPVAPAATGSAPAMEEIDEGLMATFEQARADQDKVLAESADLIAGAGTASVEDLDAGLLALNRVVLRNRQAVAALRSQGNPQRQALVKELREVNVQVLAAYDELLAQHPDPDTMQAKVQEDNENQ
jgi:hypothetical protein